jgi:hypothetical protein
MVSQPGERAAVDHRPHEVAEVGHVTHPDILDHGHHAVSHCRPETVRYVCPGGGAALLPLVLVGSANHPDGERIHIGACVRQYEVLAPGLAHDARVTRVAVQVGSDLLPEALEHRGRAGEVDAGEPPVGEQDLAHLDGVA